MGGLLQQFEILEGHRRGDDLHLTGIADGVTQAHFTAVLTALAGLGQHLTFADFSLAGDHRLSIGGKVVHITRQHPHPAQTLGLEGDVALTVCHFTGLDRLLVAHLTGQVADHILGGLLHTLLDGTSCDLGDCDVGLNHLVVVNKQQGAIGDINLLSLALARRLDREGEVHLSLLGIDTVGGAIGANPGLAAEFNGACHLGANHAGLSGRHTAGVESPHGELRSRLTNGLGRDDADGFTQINQFVMGQSPAVALAANGAVGFTGEGRAHAHSRDTGLLETAGQRRINLRVAFSEHGAIGTHHLIRRQAADQTAAETAILGLDNDVAGGAAVVLADDHVLGNVHQTAGEISGVSGPQSRIHQTFTGAVGGDHVLGDRQTLPEIGADRKVNDLALRVRHQTPHAHQLTHLGHVSPGPGVGHHPHRVQRCVVVKVLLDGVHQTLVGLRPGVDHLGVPFHLGDFSQAIALFRCGDLLLGLTEQFLFGLGHLEVIHRDGHRSLGGVFETEILQVVGHGSRHRCAVVLVRPRHKLLQTALVDHMVAERRRSLAEGAGCRNRCLVGILGGFALAGFTGFGGRGGHGSAQIREVKTKR